jgi:hypothetical protein
VQVGRFPVGPVAGLAQTGYVWHGRVAAGGDNDPVALELGPVHLHATKSGEARLGFVDGHPVALVAFDLVAVVEVADHVVAVLGHLAPRLLGRGGAGGALRLEANLGRAQQRPGRDAGPVGALAADQLALDERGAKPELGQSGGRDLPCGTGPDDDRIEAFGH